MSFTKQAEIQRSAVENAEELQFYLRDLKQWEAEIKCKDRELLGQKSAVTGDEGEINVETVRGDKNSSNKTASVEKRKKKKSDKKKQPKIPSYDYAAWDKFNVEKGCEDIARKSEDDITEDESDDDDEEAEILRAKQQAILEKNKGNDYLNAGKLDEAINCYTRGRQLDPFNALLPANRALALLKKQQFGAAEADCDATIALDPTYVKAFQRRAVARMALKKYSLAKDDLLAVLRLEPKNKEAKNELTKAEEVIRSLASATPIEVEDTGQVVSKTCNGRIPISSLQKPRDLHSKKPLHRIKVIEVSGPEVTEMADNSKIAQELNGGVTSSTTTVTESVSDRIEKKSKHDIIKTEDSMPNLPDPPLSSYQFQKDYRRLRNHQDLLYRYLKLIPCAKYPSLFQHSLESEVISQMLLVYRDYYMWNNDDLYDPLWNLTQTKRFSALKLFFSDSDKQVLAELFDHMAKTKMRSENELKELKVIYGIK